MIKRYSTEGMSEIWSEERKWCLVALVETTVLRARVALGELSLTIPESLPDDLVIDPAEIARIEREKTDHDVAAFLEHTSPQLPEELRPWWHHKLTSYDPQDTALFLQLRECVRIFQKKLEGLMSVLRRRAFEHKYIAQIGRTHGVHAEPITFGVKLANWYDECHRHARRLVGLYEQVSVGKISGVVGMYTLPPAVEEKTCELLGLRPIISTQIISRDIIAEYLAVIALIGGTIAKISTNIRTMQRTELREAQEYFSPTQKGSSAMPHKRNPWRSENLTGLARLLRAYSLVGFDDQETWDERDISNSGPERIILPDASHLLDYMLTRQTAILEKLIVFPQRMKQNLELTRGLVFSQDIQALVAAKGGIPREEAYQLVRDVAQACWDSGLDFFDELRKVERIMSHITEEELRGCFDLEAKLQYVDAIFDRVFRQNPTEE